MAWHVPVAHGNASAAVIIQALSETGVIVSDFTVDAPTLDDVFLNLTSTTPDKNEERAA
jgi:ABC-2 type transport system ATP-binding protein